MNLLGTAELCMNLSSVGSEYLDNFRKNTTVKRFAATELYEALTVPRFTTEF